jgi:integrase
MRLTFSTPGVLCTPSPQLHVIISPNHDFPSIYQHSSKWELIPRGYASSRIGLAVEWGIDPTAPKIKLVRGEHHRERVITLEEERRYLAAAGEQMAEIATVPIDTGMRPEENSRLRWAYMNWTSGHCGTLQVTHGKTAAARRMLPMSPRVRALLERRWQAAKNPAEGFV